MTDQSIQYRIQAAQVLVREAGLYALNWFRNLDSLQAEKKGPQDWVSEADREVEKMIQRRLKTLFPEDGFFGEESGLQEQNSEGLWVVDPIDGTSCFLRGMSSWCVSIAFVVKNEIEIGDSNNDSVIITKGLSEGDVVYLNKPEGYEASKIAMLN